MCGGEREAGGAPAGEERAGKEGRKEGEAEERGSKVTPSPEEKKKPVSAEVQNPRSGSGVVPGETLRPAAGDVEVKEKEGQEIGKRGGRLGE